VQVRCWVRELASRRVTFGYAVERAGTAKLLATGVTSLVSLTHQHTVTRLPQQSSTCSNRFRIRCASRALALSLTALSLCGPAARSGIRCGGRVGRLLAAADTRVYDTALFRETLHHSDPFVRRQAAFAAGRIGERRRSTAHSPHGGLGPGRAGRGGVRTRLLKATSRRRRAASRPRTTRGRHRDRQDGRDEAAAALTVLLGSGASATAVQRAALLEAWRLGARAPIAALMTHARNADPVARCNAVYALARLQHGARRAGAGRGARDPEASVRAAALRGLSRVLTDSAHVPAGRGEPLRPLLGDGDAHVRVNALRALATFHGQHPRRAGAAARGGTRI